MGATKNKQFRNMQAKNYIQAVFADRLREEGFVCPDDKLLCWYRVANQEILHSVCFFSRWSNVPITMEIGYGVHPLFVNPFYSSDIYISKRPDDERFYTAVIDECGPLHHFAPYSEDALVYAPKFDGRGIYTLSDIILPQINDVQTMEQCYRFHRKKSGERSSPITPTFIDEAIYLDDTSAYSNCKRAADKLLSIYQRNCELSPTKKEYKDTLLQLQQQKRVLFDGARDEYLGILEQRRKKTVEMISKKFGITV